MKLRLITKVGTVVDEDVSEIILPTSQGSIAIFQDHTPIITDIVSGVVTYRRPDNRLHELAVIGGIAEVNNSGVRLLVDDASETDGISEADAQLAKKRAEILLSQATDQLSLEEARKQLSYSTLKLKLAARKKRHI